MQGCQFGLVREVSNLQNAFFLHVSFFTGDLLDDLVKSVEEPLVFVAALISTS